MAVFSNIHPILRRIPVFPVPNRLFNQVGSIGAAVFIAQGLPDARRVARVFRVADECAQPLRQILCRQLIARNRFLNTLQGYICNSRPRRFGKSITANMLTAYYSKGCDSQDLFAGLKISEASDFKKHLNQYDVIHLDIQLREYDKA